MEKREEQIVDETIEKLKIKKPKKKKFDQQEGETFKVDLKELVEKAEDVVKIDLSKPVEEIKAPQEKPTELVNEVDLPVIEEVTSEVTEVEQVAEIVEQEIKQSMEAGVDFPEGVQKLMGFMEDTGGDLNDYVKLNQDFSEMDNHTLLKKYYDVTKPHLKTDEIDFIMEDKFSFDEDVDEEIDIKRKKLAMKEQVAEAKLHLESVKSKYYEDIKSGSKLTGEQQEAINFFSKHNERSESNKKMSDIFRSKTENVFNEKFKGFEYNVGEKKFRFNIKDTDKVKTDQTDINNFIKKFLNKDEIMEDARGYHKGLFTAMNPDQVANHFYEQGKADALKDSFAKSKNVSMDPRQSHVENMNTSGFTARVLNNDNAPDFKFKIKTK